VIESNAGFLPMSLSHGWISPVTRSDLLAAAPWDEIARDLPARCGRARCAGEAKEVGLADGGEALDSTLERLTAPRRAKAARARMSVHSRLTTPHNQVKQVSR
jgi:hypothetical protein